MITNRNIWNMCIAFIVLCASTWTIEANAFERNSFRLRGMGTGLSWIVDDSFSDIFNNPATMVELKGMSLYTNLSNIDDQGNTSFLSTHTATKVDPTGTLLLGGHWVNEEQSWGVGLFVEWGDINIIGKASTFGGGGKDSLLDYDSVVEHETLNFDTVDIGFRDLAVLLPFSMRISREITVGTVLMYEDFSGSVKLGTENGSEQLMQVGNFQELRTQFASSTSEASFNNNWQVGGLAGARYAPLDGSMVLEAVLGYAPVRLNVGLGTLDNFVGGTALGLALDEATQYASPDGFDIYASAIQAHFKAVFPLSDDLRVTGIAGYQMVSYNPEVTQIDRASFTSKRTQEGYSYSSNSTVEQRANLDTLIHHIPVRAGIDWNFVDWGTFAIGVNAHISLINVNYVRQPTTSLQQFNYVNPPFDHSYVSEIFFSDNNYEELSGDFFTTILSFPVGVEVAPSDWFYLRMGAETFVPLVTSGSVSGYNVDESDFTQVTTTAAAGGVVGVAKNDEDAPIVRAKEKIEHEAQDEKLTVYSAGLGVRFNDNLRLDALSFADLTDLSFWKFSLSFDYQF